VVTAVERAPFKCAGFDTWSRAYRRLN